MATINPDPNGFVFTSWSCGSCGVSQEHCKENGVCRIVQAYLNWLEGRDFSMNPK